MPTLTAALMATLLALLAILLAFGRRWLGTQPATFLVMLLALATPLATAAIWPHTGGLQLTWSLAVLLPALAAMLPLYQVMMGSGAARVPAVLPLLAALGAAGLAVVAGMAPAAPGPDLHGGTPLGLVAFGAILTGTLLASGSVVGLLQRWPLGRGFVPAFALVPLSTVVLTLIASYLLALAGVALPGSPTQVPLVAPLAGTLVAGLITGVYAWHETSLLAPEIRRELFQVGGDRALLDEYRSVDRRFKSSLQEGNRVADTYRELLEHDADGTYIAHTSGRIEYANAALGTLVGQPGERLTGVNVTYLFGGNEGSQARFEDFPLQPGTHRRWITLPNGHKRPVEVRVHRTEEGLIQGRVRDLTEELLRSRIEKHKEEIERQKERAEFYVDLLRHDIGNYVTGPLTFLDVILRRDDLHEDVRLRLEMAATNLDEIAALLERIDVLSDLDQVRATPVDAAAIARNVAERFTAKHPELDLQLELPETPVRVQGSPLLEEVFVNLVGNALRHAGEDARVTLGAQPGEDGTWELYVGDDGPGIPDEKKEAVFGRSVHDQQANGKGLGLYIVRTVVDALDGEVRVEDRVPGEHEQGACFRVTLPAADAQASQTGSPSRLDSADEGAAAAG